MKPFQTLALLLGLAATPVVALDADELAGAIQKAGADPAAATMIIMRTSDSRTWITNAARADQAFSPASTSKIPHTLIALETGTAKPPTPFVWDKVERSFESWNQDQTLLSAYQRSAVWVYQQITTSLGADAMADWMQRLEYGNRDTGSADDLTSYWLAGPLKISAWQQVHFIKRLVETDLPLSARTFRTARDIMEADAGDGWKIFAKTGWRHDDKTQDIGWYVGWVEVRGDGPADAYVFAFNMDMDGGQDRDKRIEAVRHAFVALDILPQTILD